MQNCLKLVLVSLCGLVLGCSIRDPSDEEQLENILRAQPASVLGPIARAAATDNSIEWLKDQFPFDKVIDLTCRDQGNVGADGLGKRWEVNPSLLSHWVVKTLILCLEAQNGSYDGCITSMIEGAEQDANAHYAQFAGTNIHCQGSVVPGYRTSDLPSNCKSDRITLRDEMKYILRTPVMPSGFNPGAAGEVAEFLLQICPLNVGPGWGCPDRAGGDHQ